MKYPYLGDIIPDPAVKLIASGIQALKACNKENKLYTIDAAKSIKEYTII